MLGDVRLRVGPGAHHFLHFVFSHLVLSQSDVVAEKSSAELVCDGESDKGAPGNAEDHIEGDGQGSDSAQLVVSTQMVDGHAADCQTIKRHAEGNVAGPLLLLLGEQELVRLVLQLSTLAHCTSPNHCNFCILIAF